MSLKSKRDIVRITTLDDTKNFASSIAQRLIVGDILAITGEIGSGKTTLCANIIKYFFPNIVATSPTFNLVNIYDNKLHNLHHYDLYRLNTLDEALNIGIEESFSKAITLIEWPCLIKEILPKNIINIEISIINNERIISIEDNRY